MQVRTDAVWPITRFEFAIRRAVRADYAASVDTLRASIIRLCLADHGERQEWLWLWHANKTAPNAEQ